MLDGAALRHASGGGCNSHCGCALAGGALSLCLAAWAVTPLFGAFPVPLVGVGMSPILGAWLGVGLLAATARARTY